MDEEELLNSRSTMFQDHFATEPEWASEKLISDGKSHWNRSNTRRVMSSLLTQAIFDFHMGYVLTFHYSILHLVSVSDCG
jgi:hypothetical protein